MLNFEQVCRRRRHSSKSEHLFVTQVPADAAADDGGQVYEMGMKFQATVEGKITGIRFYRSAGDVTGDGYTGHLWNASETEVASVVFGTTVVGWNQALLATPYQILDNTTYLVSVNANGKYPFTSGGLASVVTNKHIVSVDDDTNGVFNTTRGELPDTSFGEANYFRDVVFKPHAYWGPVHRQYALEYTVAVSDLDLVEGIEHNLLGGDFTIALLDVVNNPNDPDLRVDLEFATDSSDIDLTSGSIPANITRYSNLPALQGFRGTLANIISFLADATGATLTVRSDIVTSATFHVTSSATPKVFIEGALVAPLSAAAGVDTASALVEAVDPIDLYALQWVPVQEDLNLTVDTPHSLVAAYDLGLVPDTHLLTSDARLKVILEISTNDPDSVLDAGVLPAGVSFDLETAAAITVKGQLDAVIAWLTTGPTFTITAGEPTLATYHIFVVANAAINAGYDDPELGTGPYAFSQVIQATV